MVYGPGVYEFTIKAKSGSKTPLENDFIVELTLIDPCITAAFTLDPALLPSPYDYVVSFPKDIQTLLDSACNISDHLFNFAIENRYYTIVLEYYKYVPTTTTVLHKSATKFFMYHG